MARRTRQLSLDINGWGGKRKNAGRKRVAPRPQVPHRTRPEHAARFPLLVTVRLRPEWRGLRHDKVAGHVRDIVARTNARGLIRICEYTAIDDHVHMMVEAANRLQLTRGMKGFSVRMAHRLHRLRGRLGSVVADRYHARELRTPLEVKRGLTYVLNNARKHGYRIRPGHIDRCSSGPWTDAFLQGIGPERHGRRIRAPTLPPQTWLLLRGWKRHGLVDVDEVPGAPRAG